MIRTLRALGAILLATTVAACGSDDNPLSPSFGPASSTSSTTASGKTATDSANATTRWNFHLYCESPASAPRVQQFLNSATGEHPLVSVSVGNTSATANGLSFDAPAGAKMNWSASIVDSNNTVVGAYKLETEPKEITAGDTVEMVFSRVCGGNPPPTPPSCSIANPRVRVGDDVVATGTGTGKLQWSSTGTPTSWTGATYSTKFNTVGTHDIVLKDDVGEAKCSVNVEPRVIDPPPSCQMVTGNLDLTVQVVDATHAVVIPNAGFTGPTGTVGTLIVDGKPATPGARIPFERYGPGVPHDISATYATALSNGQSCDKLSKVVAIPPQDDHGNPCFQIVTGKVLGSGLLEVRSKTVGLVSCTGSGVLARVQLDAHYTSKTVTPVVATGEYSEVDHSDGDKTIEFGMREIPPMFEAVYQVGFTAPGAKSATVCSSDKSSNWTLWTCAPNPIPLP